MQELDLCVAQKMCFTGLLVLLFLQEAQNHPLHRHRVLNAKFKNISREAFKKLTSKSWKGIEITGRGGEIVELAKNRRNSKYPTELDLNATKLKEILADGFEPQFMSETEPNRAWPNSENELDRRSEFEASKHEEGVKDSITEFMDRKRVRLNKIEFEDIRFWLWNLTRCTVEPLWKDFGAKIWPRYVNVGKCSDKTTCSLPSGMKCRPSDEKTVRLLYWICLKSTRRCAWSFFETKIIRACSCACEFSLH